MPEAIETSAGLLGRTCPGQWFSTILKLAQW